MVLILDTRLERSDTIRVNGMSSSQAHASAVQFGLDGATLYLALHAGGDAAVLRVGRATGSVLGRQSLPEDSLTGLWPLRDGHTLVASGTTTLRFLPADLSNTGRQITVCDEPITDVTAFGVRDRAYAVCGESTIVEIDRKLEIVVRSASFVSVDSVDGASCGTGGVATSPSGSIVYVLCRQTGRLLYIDRLTLTPFDSVDVGASGHDMVLVPGGRRAVVTRPSANELVVVDLRDREVASRVHLEAPWSAAVGADGHHAYVTTRTIRGPGRLLRINLESSTVTGTTQALQGASGITVWPSTGSPRMRWN